MKKTIITCDNCGQRMPDHARPLRVGRTEKDFCSYCVSLILETGFIDRQASENAMGDLRLAQQEIRRLRVELAEIRALAPKAIEEWARGADPRATLTKISTHAASQ